eukprot:SAG31_NODE_1920_length_6919_cov_7.423754_5_plen_463_part_00
MRLQRRWHRFVLPTRTSYAPHATATSEFVSTFAPSSSPLQLIRTAVSHLPGLLALAEREGKHHAMADTLFDAYFCKRQNIADLNTLVAAAERVGLTGSGKDSNSILSFLAGDELVEDMQTAAMHATAAKMVIPHFSISELVQKDSSEMTTVHIANFEGAQEREVFVQAFGEADAAAPTTAHGASESAGRCSLPSSRNGAITAAAILSADALTDGWRQSSLLPDMLNAQGFPGENPFRPEHFERLDEHDDASFYSSPRINVHHLDEPARSALTAHYTDVFDFHCSHPDVLYDSVPQLSVLDLCSSWVSHYPQTPNGRAVGIGMNLEELKHNHVLSEYSVQDLNLDPLLQRRDNEFDVVTMALSVDYLTRPLEVFREAHRVLKAGGHLVVSFSDRMFAPKAVGVWRDGDDSAHIWTVAAYFHFSQTRPSSEVSTGVGWKDLVVLDLSPDDFGGDPLFVVQATKA